MTIVPFPSAKSSAKPAAPEPPATRPDPIPIDQAELDRLYWDESGTVKVAHIGALFGISGSKIAKLATPKPTDVPCLICGGRGVVRSRSQLKEPWIGCGYCGAACRQREDRYGRYARTFGRRDVEPALQSVGVSAALVRRRRDSSAQLLGMDAYRAVDALADIGRPLEPEAIVTVIEPADGLIEMRAALSGQSPSVLGVSTLRTLGGSQTEALQNLYALTSDGWRIVSAQDSEVWHSVGFREMEALSWGDHRVFDERWGEETHGDLGFGDRLINATSERLPRRF